jgi:hypothetical protein
LCQVGSTEFSNFITEPNLGPSLVNALVESGPLKLFSGRAVRSHQTIFGWIRSSVREDLARVEEIYLQ